MQSWYPVGTSKNSRTVICRVLRANLHIHQCHLISAPKFRIVYIHHLMVATYSTEAVKVPPHAFKYLSFHVLRLVWPDESKRKRDKKHALKHTSQKLIFWGGLCRKWCPKDVHGDSDGIQLGFGGASFLFFFDFASKDAEHVRTRAACTNQGTAFCAHGTIFSKPRIVDNATGLPPSLHHKE